jgi:hypothetical protein
VPGMRQLQDSPVASRGLVNRLHDSRMPFPNPPVLGWPDLS